ncbi:MAG: hypothetical protein RLZZ306_1199, partial [Bacteroidota bacterium]
AYHPINQERRIFNKIIQTTLDIERTKGRSLPIIGVELVSKIAQMVSVWATFFIGVLDLLHFLFY